MQKEDDSLNKEYFQDFYFPFKKEQQYLLEYKNVQLNFLREYVQKHKPKQINGESYEQCVVIKTDLKIDCNKKYNFQEFIMPKFSK